MSLKSCPDSCQPMIRFGYPASILRLKFNDPIFCPNSIYVSIPLRVENDMENRGEIYVNDASFESRLEAFWSRK
jgi:hypothetical protein